MLLKLLMIPLLALVVFAALGAWAPVRTLNAIVPETSRFSRGVAYGENARQKLDIYRPTDPAPAAGYPMVVFFYGGSWNTGERGQYKFVGEALASRGILTLVADYRLYPEVTYPDFLHDCARALGHAFDQAAALGADLARIFVMGHSAGAYNAAMMALDDRWLQAQGHGTRQLAGWIGLAGPYDFLPIVNPDAKPVFHHPNYPDNTQAIDFALPGSPPSLIVAAENDKLVNPQRNSAQMAQRLRDNAVAVTYKTYPNASHLTLVGAFAWPLRWIAPVLDDVVAFVESYPQRSGATAPMSQTVAVRATQARSGLATKGAR